MLPFLTEWYGNPSSVHRFGRRARAALETARQQLASLIGASPAEIIFTGGGTEAVNTAIRGLFRSRQPRKKIVISSVEHSAVRQLCTQLVREGGEVQEIGVDRAGLLDLDELANAVDDGTALVSLMWANNETGVIFPVGEIAELCRARRVPFRCNRDAGGGQGSRRCRGDGDQCDEPGRAQISRTQGHQGAVCAGAGCACRR